MMLVFTLMFTVLRAKPAADVPFPLFAYSGLIPWTMFSSGRYNASTALTSHAGLLTKVSPRDPSAHLRGRRAGDLSIASVVLACLMVWFGVPLQLTALWAIVAVVLLTGLLIGLGLLLSAAQVRFRDVGLAMCWCRSGCSPRPSCIRFRRRGPRCQSLCI